MLMEEALFIEGTRRFSQTDNETPMDPAVTEQIGFWGEKEGASQILQGTFNTNHIQDKYLKLLIDQLRSPSKIQSIDTINRNITLDEHIREWRSQTETTASANDTLGFRHHIAATFHTELAKVDLLLRHIPYTRGFAPEEYKKIVDYQILKKAGTYAVESMRTIQLMNAAFNLNNKHTARLAMKRAEKYNLIPWEQAGSRKRRRAILSALDKVLTMDIARANRLPCVVISCDAVSCYDRIVLWIAALAFRRVGVDQSVTYEMMESLQKATHKVATAFGTSSKGYKSRTRNPFQGIGQGNGAGPATWELISALILSIMAQQGFGINITTIISLTAMTMVGFAFVDDTDLILSSFAPDPTYSSKSTSSSYLRKTAQTALNTWEGLIRATGGALHVKKSFWYSIDFKFQKNKWKYKSINDDSIPTPVTMRDRDGIIKPLDRF